MSIVILPFAILMPARNEALLIGRVSASVRRYFPRARLIVIDDGSGDEIAQVATEAPGPPCSGCRFPWASGGRYRPACAMPCSWATIPR